MGATTLLHPTSPRGGAYLRFTRGAKLRDMGVGWGEGGEGYIIVSCLPC